MNRTIKLLVSTILVVSFCLTTCSKSTQKSMRVVEPVHFSTVKINDSFWSPILKTHASATLSACIDQIENKTGRIQNYRNAANNVNEHQGIFFDDSDVYKAMEGMAYSLINNPDPAIEAKLDEWIDLIAAAQEPDGYLNTFYSITGLDNRWTDMDKHEMYCAGHMLEAAIAYYHATGKDKFLEVSKKMVEHMMSVFGPEKRHWVPGHQEIELALVKLYDLTKDERYLNFAHWLLEERGYGRGIREGKPWNAAYYQDNIPVKDLSEVSGHAVRCMYMYCGMADVAALKNDTAYVNALNRIWDNLIHKRMYITGGIGSSRHNEGFTEDYDLPNKEAYCETCASVGMVFWNHRMNELSGDAKYINILEKALYNGVLSGVSLSGDRFFYVNPLESDGGHHRQAWYGCACCPSQVSRFIPSIGSYIYGKSDDAVWVNLFISSETDIQLKKNKVQVKQTTEYPWDGKVTIKINPKKEGVFEVKVRKPNWTNDYTVQVNGTETTINAGEDGYLTFKQAWGSDNTIELAWAMDIKQEQAHPKVKENEGKRAIQRGPVIYCMEEIDNPDYHEAAIHSNDSFSGAFNRELLNGVYTIQSDHNLSLIPYYSWDNRDAGKMKVWIDFKE